MNQEQYYKYYCSAVNLYGFLYTTELIQLIRFYHPKEKKTDLDKDVRFYLHHLSDDFFVLRITSSNYLIMNRFFEDEDLARNDFDYISEERRYKPWFIPESEEEFFAFAHVDFPIVESKALRDMKLYLNYTLKKKDASSFLDTVLDSLTAQNPFADLSQRVNILPFKKEEDFRNFVPLFQNMANNTRLWENNGYTPNELRILEEKYYQEHPEERKPIELSFGPGIEKLIQEGTWDSQKMKEQITHSTMDEKTKESLLKEVERIERETKK